MSSDDLPAFVYPTSATRYTPESQRALLCTPLRFSSSASSRRSVEILSRIRRRSTSSWLSPWPNRLPMPPRVCSPTRWLHMPLSLGSTYWSCASCTWRRPSRVFACCPKISRISAVRSRILTGSSTLPLPMKVFGTGASRRCFMVRTTSAPSVWARRASSASESSQLQLPIPRSTPTRIAFSATGAV